MLISCFRTIRRHGYVRSYVIVPEQNFNEELCDLSFAESFSVDRFKAILPTEFIYLR